MKGLEGIIVPIVTPKLANGVDIKGLQKVAERAIAAGVGGIFALGTTGESMALQVPYKKEVIDALIDRIGGRVPLLVGVSSDYDPQTLGLVDYCNDRGVDALVVAPEFGSRMDPERIIARTSVPIMLYNNPEIQDGCSLHLDDIEAWALNPQFIGIKDSWGDRNYFNELLVRVNDSGFRVFQGRESSMDWAESQQAYGLIAGTANVYPKEFVDAWRTRDFNSVLKLRSGIRARSSNYVRGLKLVLAEEGVIDSAEMWS